MGSVQLVQVTWYEFSLSSFHLTNVKYAGNAYKSATIKDLGKFSRG